MSTQSIISLEHVNIYRKKSLVLSDVSVKINDNEFVYLIGKTGSGKSSLLATLYADIPLTEGDAEVAAYKLKKLKRRKIPYLRRKLGIVFQDFQLLSDRNVRDNLWFVAKATGWRRKKKIRERIHDVLERVGVADKIYQMPHELSGGEQQRVAIARAIINDPPIILADEPTGNLDPETSEEIMRLLFEISQSGRAILMATHDHGLMEKFPARKIKCEEGQVHEIPNDKKVGDNVGDMGMLK